MQLLATIRSITRFLYFMKMFYETISASEGTGKIVGDVIVASLMDPIMLAHAATHQIIEQSPKKSSKQIRPGTPGPLSTITLTSLAGRETKKIKDLAEVLLETPTSPLKLEPILVIKKKKSFSKSPIVRKSLSFSIEQHFYEDIKAAIASYRYEAVSRLSSKPEMQALTSDQLLNLLNFFRN